MGSRAGGPSVERAQEEKRLVAARADATWAIRCGGKIRLTPFPGRIYWGLGVWCWEGILFLVVSSRQFPDEEAM